MDGDLAPPSGLPAWQRFAAFAFTAAVMLLGGPSAAVAQTAEAPPLQLEGKIALGSVKGRIDHMAVDGRRHRLFVAELGNDTVGVVDLNDRKIVHRIAGLKEPQGVAYVPSSDTIYVANGGDGSVRSFRAADYAEAGRVDLGHDADNVRVDLTADRVFVGYGNGGLAAIDPASHRKIAEIPVKAHPEGFQLSGASPRIFVNVPRSRAIVVLDRSKQRESARWPLADASGNFPMALDDASGHVIVVFRNPARLGVFAMETGSSVAQRETCEDADDVFLDGKRKRVYVSCGGGFVDVFDAAGGAYKPMAHIATVAGARTSLFLREEDRYVVAARAQGNEPAALWIYRPIP